MTRQSALRGIGILLAVVLVPSLASWAVVIFLLCKPSKDIVSTTTLAESVSPDGAWKAIVDETTTEGEWVTVIDAYVHLVAARDPPQHADILMVDTGGNSEYRQKIDWTAPDILRVTVRNLSDLSVTAREFRGVRIDLRFEPDDPAARAAWLRTHDRRPDSDLEREW